MLKSTSLVPAYAACRNLGEKRFVTWAHKGDREKASAGGVPAQKGNELNTKVELGKLRQLKSKPRQIWPSAGEKSRT